MHRTKGIELEHEPEISFHCHIHELLHTTRIGFKITVAEVVFLHFPYLVYFGVISILYYMITLYVE